MTNRMPLLLSIICLIVGALIFFSEKKWRSTNELKLREKRLFEIEPDSVDRIAIRCPGEDIRLGKKEGKWRLQEPIDYPANEEEVNALLSDLEYLELIQVFDLEKPEKELEQYGLKNPRFVLRANWGEEQIELRIGSETALTNSVYVQSQKNASEVKVINRAIVDRLAQNFDNWRDRQVIEFDPNQVSKIVLRNSTKEIEIQKKEEGWYVIRPLYARASGQVIENLLQNLQQAKIESFVSENNSSINAWGLNEPQVRVQLFYPNKKEKVAGLQLGSNDPERSSVLFARRGADKSIFTLHTNLLEVLTLTTETYQDKKVVRFSPQQIAQIRLYQDNILTHRAIQTNGVWYTIQNNGLKSDLNSLAIQSFLMRLKELEVSRFVSETSANLEQYGLLVPQVRIELESKDQSKPIILFFSKIQGEERLVHLEQEPFIVSVFQHHTDFLQVTPWAWMDLTVSKFDSKTINQFSIKKDKITTSYRRENATWLNDNGLKTDSIGVESVVQIVANLKAKEWLGTNVITAQEPDWCFRWQTAEVKELCLWNQEQKTIGFFKGGNNWFFELDQGEATLLQQTLEDVKSTNNVNTGAQP